MLLQQGVRQEAPTMLLNATAYSLLKFTATSLLSLLLLRENKNTGLYQIKLNKAGYFQEQRKLNSPDCTAEVTPNVLWPKPT